MIFNQERKKSENKENRPNNDWAIQANHRVKIKENEKKKRKKDNYLDIARELKAFWNMKVTVIQIVISAVRAILKGLIKTVK